VRSCSQASTFGPLMLLPTGSEANCGRIEPASTGCFQRRAADPERRGLQCEALIAAPASTQRALSRMSETNTAMPAELRQGASRAVPPNVNARLWIRAGARFPGRFGSQRYGGTS
jgi:hypothetical protein